MTPSWMDHDTGMTSARVDPNEIFDSASMVTAANNQQPVSNGKALSLEYINRTVLFFDVSFLLLPFGIIYLSICLCHATTTVSHTLLRNYHG